MTSFDAVAPELRPVPFTSTFTSEWTKLTTLRSTYITLGLAFLLALAISLAGAFATGATWDEWGAAERADFDPVLFALLGTIASGILFVVAGVKAVTSEYSTGMMRITLTATPKRERVLLAKVTALGAVMLIAGIFTTVGVVFASNLVYASYDLPTASAGDPDVLRAVLGAGALTPVYPILAAALAFVLRGAASSITAMFAFIFAPAIFLPFGPDWIESRVLIYLPGAASDSVAIGHLDDVEHAVSPAVGIVVVAVWIAIFLGVAYIVFSRRDA